MAVRETLVAEAGAAREGLSLIAPLLDRLALAGLRPHAGETLKTFLHRATPPVAGEVSRAQMLHGYYRARYATDGFNAEEERQLAQQIARFTNGLAD